MCLAIPGEILSITDDGLFAEVSFMGVMVKVCIQLLSELYVGDYVIVHAGYAISKVSKEDAVQNMKYLEEIYESEAKYDSKTE